MWLLVRVALVTAPLTSPLFDVEDPWRAGGNFGNDTWLPRDVSLEQTLAGADEALGADDPDTNLDGVFSAWNSALEGASSGIWVRWDTRMHWGAAAEDPLLWSDRRTEGVASAILVRQSARGGALRGPWLEYIDTEADAALEAALRLPVERSRAPLSMLSARYPGTRASVRAALMCSELDRERGRSHHARSWLSRAEHGARLLADETLISAVAARRATPELGESERWETADRWEFVDFEFLTNDLHSPASGVRGLTRWNTDQVLIQSAELGWTLGTGGSAQAFSLQELADEAGQPLPKRWSRPGSGWRHQPSARGDLAFSVLGRVREVRSNALIAYRPGTTPVPLWSVGEGGWCDADANRIASLEESLGPGVWEFQPRPLVVDDLLIVQARRWKLAQEGTRARLADPARAEAVALALKISSGALVWKTTLARGSDLFGDPEARFTATQTPSLSAPPPVLCGSSLVFATGLGACAAVDLADGRPQRAILGQRVEGGFSEAAIPVPTNDESVLWVPYGGDKIYELALGPAHPALSTSPFAHQPRAATGWSSLIGASGGRPLAAVARGGRHQVELVTDGTTQAPRSVQLSPGEALVGAHVLGSERLLTVSDRGLFVFDLERELYLVGHVPLDPRVICLPEGLVVSGSWAWILTEEGVYRLRVS